MDNLDLLVFYCKKYGLTWLTCGGYCNGKPLFYYIASPWSIKYVDLIYADCLRDMNESEIESFVIKCAMEDMA